jgi:hypothetical protein
MAVRPTHRIPLGSVKPAVDAAVTIDTNNSVNNQGTIQITGANDSTGILANAGTAGTITNSGKIILDETFTPTDTDTDGDLDGTFAQGARRYGIRVGSGGTFTGNIVNSGEITSRAMTAPASGSTATSPERSRAASRSTSSATIPSGSAPAMSPAMSASPAPSRRAAPTASASPSTAISAARSPSRARSSRPAIVRPPRRPTLRSSTPTICSRAVRRCASPATCRRHPVRRAPANNSTTDDDEDDDGVKDADEAVATVRAFGAAPAVQIGSATGDVAIGAVAGNAAGHGIVVKGEISGNGVYSGVTGNGLVIGGWRQRQVAGGLTVSGLIGAQASSAGATRSASATGQRFR